MGKMNKFIKNFKEGLDMYSKSLYGDINLLHEEAETPKKVNGKKYGKKRLPPYLRVIK